MVRAVTELGSTNNVKRTANRQSCRGYGDSHGYGYGMGMGTVMNPHGFCG